MNLSYDYEIVFHDSQQSYLNGSNVLANALSQRFFLLVASPIYCIYFSCACVAVRTGYQTIPINRRFGHT